MPLRKPANTEWTNERAFVVNEQRGGGDNGGCDDGDGGGEKRCEKLLAAMRPFCLNQIEISTFYACWLFEIVQMNEETKKWRTKRGEKSVDGLVSYERMGNEYFWILIIMAGGAFNTIFSFNDFA